MIVVFYMYWSVYILTDVKNSIVIEFPLRGEWLSPTTPGKKIPSHGTNRYGTRYAYDFLQVDWLRKGLPSYRIQPLRYLLFGASLEECYCWGEDIYAPCDGVILSVEDGYKERNRAHLLSDMYIAIKSAFAFNLARDNIKSIAGNYIIMKCDDEVYAAFVHLQTGSIKVKVGQFVKKSDVIGRVGHSGNSFGPHLHFQLMDSDDIENANGLPCAFERYEVLRNGEWQEVYNSIPSHKDRIRFREKII